MQFKKSKSPVISTGEEKIDSVDNLVNDIVRYINIDKFCYLIEATENSFTSGLYEFDSNGAKYSNKTVTVFKTFSQRIQELLHGKGILLIWVDFKAKPMLKFISHYNKELFTTDVFELIIFQELGIEPSDYERKQVLNTSLEAETIKNTLVYACYENKTDKILDILKKARKADLDKRLEYVGTPLGLCARNNNITAFKSIADAGAKISKVSLADTPLAIAFTYSSDIVKFIYSSFRAQFDKEVLRKGFGIAVHTKDIELLQLLLECGCDVNCHGKPFPPLHNYADFNNIIGLKFLIENGADINTKNQYKQTPIDRAKARNNQEAIEFLKLHGAIL